MASRRRSRKPAPRRVASLQQDIKAFEDTERSCLELLSMGPAVAARKSAADLRRQLDRMLDLEDIDADGISEVDRLKLRIKLAERDGSWQAVAAMSRTIAELEVGLEHAKAAQAAAEMEGLSLEELIDIIISALDTLPFDLVSQVYDKARARVEQKRPNAAANAGD